MKHRARLVAAALLLLVSLAVLAVSVETQERGRDPLRLAASASREVRDLDRAVVRMERSRELKLRKTEADTMLPGRKHERLDQYYKGIPVFGGDVVREVANNVTLSVFGNLYPAIGLDPTPVLDEQAALAVFERETGHKPAPGLRPLLIVLPRDDGSYALTWRVSQYTRLAMPVLFVNATTGVVELRYDNLQRQAAMGRGTGVLGDEKKVSAALRSGAYVADDRMRPPQIVTFDLRGDLGRAEWILAGWLNPLWSDVATDADNDWTDGAVVDAHTYLGWTYDYYFKRFGRRGLDDDNAVVRTIVHALRREDTPHATYDQYHDYLLNAFWCGGCGSDGRGYMHFGDGNRPGYYDSSSGQAFNFFAGAIDVVAHELTHGVTSYTSRLIYSNESGALDEGFADILGTGVEFYYQAAGSGRMKADYLIGEDVATASAPGSRTGMRSLEDPAAFGDPDHYSRRYTGTQDNGGVHINSTIPSHAFFLAVEGGTNRTSGLGVQGVGAANREQIERIFYRAFVYFLPANATFSTARAATIHAAQELYGAGSAPERAITQAWSAVGVF